MSGKELELIVTFRMSGKELVKERVRTALQVVLVEELPMEF
jgi:hypothetical protein